MRDTTKSWSETKAELRECFVRWGVKDWDVECETTRYSSYGLDEDARRVLVWYVHPETGEEKRLQTAGGSRPMDNLRAIFLTLDGIRLAEWRGLGDLMRQNYVQLAAPKNQRPWYSVLRVAPDATPEEVEKAYRVVAKAAHPDVEGGSEEWMRDVNRAVEEARAR